MLKIRKANADDRIFLQTLEERCFALNRRFSLSSLERSLTSAHQDLYIIEVEGVSVGSATIFRFPKTWRLYSIAILPSHRHQSLGHALLQYIINLARSENIHHLSLEVDSDDQATIAWYQSFGFRKIDKLKNYYADGQHADKMLLVLRENPTEKRYLANIAIVDREHDWLKRIPNLEIVTAETFLNDDSFQYAKELRVFNFCTKLGYQTIGYYVSLLASARGLRAIPNVATLEDATDETITKSLGDEVFDLIQDTFKNSKYKEITFKILFGETKPPRFERLGKALLRLFEAPLLDVKFVKRTHWLLNRIKILTLNDIVIDDAIIADAKRFFTCNRFAISKIKQFKYDLAILVDPKEPAPPSGKTALDRFVVAAHKVGFYTEFITKADYSRLPQFDALFIRATTNVDNYTYEFSRYAYSEGLVVIDDPWSILRCANKLYFHECMKSENIKTPKTIIVSSKTPIDKIAEEIAFPIILKRPDSASSRGVFKVSNLDELKLKLKELFRLSALLIAQEYIPSPFDWRIGILEGKPLYACKYFMARNHWQIYNWNANKSHASVGPVATYFVEDAPPAVVEIALKAANAIGDGFYGVDVKEKDGQVYVIEVNDNPSIDHHWEDEILGEKLYLQIMENILYRIEKARQSPRNSRK
ncbi:MAG: GNAT family N-acetyltransferase [Bacilli bacterium]|jgi:glutathione synthase/RimK-type ligase-like ATP-grasp enzyme/ribosomal protein S18 acetylase RimI-like enzyme